MKAVADFEKGYLLCVFGVFDLEQVRLKFRKVCCVNGKSSIYAGSWALILCGGSRSAAVDFVRNGNRKTNRHGHFCISHK